MINEFLNCKYRQYWFDELGGYAKCKIDNSKCPCIIPPKSKENAIEQGCKKDYESHTTRKIKTFE